MMAAAEIGKSGRALAVVQLASIVAILLSPFAAAAAAEGELSVDFHAASCPQLETIVRSSVEAALSQEIALAAGIIRIFFHDCFPQGCDASIYLTGGSSEQDMGPNANSLQPRALQLVEDIRAKVHKACGPTVSCADISALATRDAVIFSGGPNYKVKLGQSDSLAPAPERLVDELPSPFNANVSQAIASFATRGLGDAADLVALSGGHTIGKSRCGFRRKDNDPFSEGMNKTCTDDANQKLDLDVITPVIFDNAYYIGLTMGQGVFTSDISLFRNPITKPIVCQFATDKDAFFKQFADSMFKLSNVPRNDGNRGEIRSNCFVSNAGPRRAVDAVIEQVVDFAASF